MYIRYLSVLNHPLDPLKKKKMIHNTKLINLLKKTRKKGAFLMMLV